MSGVPGLKPLFNWKHFGAPEAAPLQFGEGLKSSEPSPLPTTEEDRC
jgi:hypothetical protein